MPDWLIEAGVLGLVSVVMWFLRNKDEQQERQLKAMELKAQADHDFQAKQIAMLFTKHDEDSHRLDQFQLQIAREHYVKQELDTRFDRLESAFARGFSDMGSKIDKLSDAIAVLAVSNGKH